jgi:hypothetical protein
MMKQASFASSMVQRWWEAAGGRHPSITQRISSAQRGDCSYRHTLSNIRQIGIEAENFPIWSAPPWLYSADAHTTHVVTTCLKAGDSQTSGLNKLSALFRHLGHLSAP